MPKQNLYERIQEVIGDILLYLIVAGIASGFIFVLFRWGMTLGCSV